MVTRTEIRRMYLLWSNGGADLVYTMTLHVKCTEIHEGSDGEIDALKLTVDHGDVTLPDGWFRFDSVPARIQDLARTFASSDSAVDAPGDYVTFAGRYDELTRSFTVVGISEEAHNVALSFSTADAAAQGERGVWEEHHRRALGRVALGAVPKK